MTSRNDFPCVCRRSRPHLISARVCTAEIAALFVVGFRTMGWKEYNLKLYFGIFFFFNNTTSRCTWMIELHFHIEKTNLEHRRAPSVCRCSGIHYIINNVIQVHTLFSGKVSISFQVLLRFSIIYLLS